MRIEYPKTTGALWLMLVCAVAFVADVKSVIDWTVLTGVALMPPILVLRFWTDPQPSTSESIREALR